MAPLVKTTLEFVLLIVLLVLFHFLNSLCVFSNVLLATLLIYKLTFVLLYARFNTMATLQLGPVFKAAQ